MRAYPYLPRKLALPLAAAIGLVVRASSAQQPPTDKPVPPVVLHEVPPTYPERGPASDRVVEVGVLVTVDDQGHVAKVEVATSGGREFDEAAVAAVRQWTFSPARRGDRAVTSRIRVLLRFPPPPVTQTSAPPPAPPTRATAPAKEAPAPLDIPVDLASESSTVFVVGHAESPSRGASDYDVRIGALSRVPRRDAAHLLTLAPGVMLSNEGGTGHPYQIWLRGFDAREGQDLEFSVDGVPINEVGNVHGNGLADTHFILPELVETLRVIEGPFDPHQGNFAVAGSASYDLGLVERGIQLRYTTGSFGTQRGLLLYGPEGHGTHTFGGVEVFKSDGYGQNRKSERATGMAGYEGKLGKTGSYHVLLTTYATHYGQAGVVRQDDYAAGRIGFYDTYDTQQGGDSSRHGVSFRISDDVGHAHVRQLVFLTLREFRLRENYTGFLEDRQQPWQTPHAQRGDLVDQHSTTTTFGGRGSARLEGKALGQRQSLEVGWFGRLDRVDSEQRRNRFGSNVPYKTDLSLLSSLGNVAAYADAQLKPVPWVTLRGGARADYFHYDVQDRCALTSQQAISEATPDRECFTADRAGYRGADARASTGSMLLQPRASLLLGPFSGVTFSVSRGTGARSLDPQYVAQGYDTPFAKVTATDGGVAFASGTDTVEVTARSTFFQTHVDQDLFFNQTEGRATLAGGTTRTGWSGNVRVTGTWFDLATSMTLTRATFDDTHLLIPYAPSLVQRTDASLFSDLPLAPMGHALRGSLAAGASYVGPRPLPFDERSPAMFLMDAAARLSWDRYDLAVSATNLLDRKYRLSELNYASDFKSAAYPTLVPTRHFTAGEPRAVYATVGVRFEEAAQ